MEAVRADKPHVKFLRQYATKLARLVFLLAVGLSVVARAETVGMESERSAEQRGRHLLQSAGLTLGFNHVFELIGGTHDSRSLPLAGGLTDLEVRWKPKLRGLFGNGEFTAIYSAYSQSRPSSTTDLQGISSLTAPSFHRWREAYFELPLRGDTRIKVGKVDANTEFSVVEGAGDLSNAGAGMSPTLFTMPSYPDGAFSANVFVAPGHGLNLGGGVYRSALGGTYFIGEGGVRWAGRRAGRVAVGIWDQTAGNSSGVAMPASSGSYFIVEQMVLPHGPGRGLQAFARLSTADETVAPASMHNMYGVSWTGFGRRRSDSAGFAFLSVLPTSDGLSLKTEKACEAYYRFPVTSFLAMKVDLQHVRRPGGLADTPAFAVASIRLFFNFSTAAEE